MLVFANGVINDPYVFAHFHFSSQIKASAAVDPVTHGVGCGGVGAGVITFLALANMFHATLWHLLLHLQTCFMLRYDILSCTCSQVPCYAMTSSLALAARCHATQWHLLLHLQPGFMLRYDIISCACSQVTCYAMTSSLARAARCHATLWHLLLHLHPGFMLRYDIFSCTCKHVSC